MRSAQILDESNGCILNPVVLVEVLSPSAASYDRGKKFAHYKLIESLREYVIVYQSRVRIEVHRRQEDGSWTVDAAEGMDAEIRLASISAMLRLGSIYDGIDLPDGSW